MRSNGNDCLTTLSNDIDLACKYYVNDYNNFNKEIINVLEE